MGRTLEMTATRLFTAIQEAVAEGHRYIVLEGGTRSSKTHSICQMVLLLALQKAWEIHVVRKAMPVLRRSALQDFRNDHLKKHGLYGDDMHDKTSEIFHVGRSEIAFFGTKEDAKLRGPERDVLWINEANEISAEEWRELRRRTRRFIIIDYNPSHGATHWIDDEVIGSGREKVILSTYLDNPFLTDAQVRDIEADVPVYREPSGREVIDWHLQYEGDGVLIAGDPAAWAVNGLGKRAKAKAIIYRHWTLIDQMPGALEEECYGLDFGYSNPCALVRVGWKDVPGEDINLIWDEILYESGLTDAQLVERLEELGIDKQKNLWCDAAEPERIQALADAGFNAKAAGKSVTDGILKVKEHRLRITRRSVNLQSEIERYRRRKDKDGNILEQPVKKADHGMDAGRYGTHSQLTHPQYDYARI